ncbi:MAG TPA: hypothetical protein VHF27_09245 [Acidimicrobiales bacterium]|nr:hypothetical protein [Acidimicrobiales bacterium]
MSSFLASKQIGQFLVRPGPYSATTVELIAGRLGEQLEPAS